ncbi:unnamed protein product [Agarophyton chilense]
MKGIGFVAIANISTRSAEKLSVSHTQEGRNGPLRWESLRKSTAALVLSAALLIPVTATAEDVPLVFDHDQSLSGADFSNRSDLRGSIFSKSNCKGASFAGSDLTSAQLDDANFQGANFEGATAVYATATRTKFQRANLKDVDFSNANLISAQFDGADIEGADFTDSFLDKVTTIALCKRASGINSRTGMSTSESLMCPE